MAHQDEEHKTTIQRKVQYPLDSNSYQIVNEIGVGVSGTVYKAICLPKKSEVAIKAIDLDKARSDFDNVRLEAKTMSLLSHPNILSAHCSFTVENRLWVVMPFMAAGSLESIMSSSFTEGLPELCIAVILKEILNALSYLHNQGHIHRDIKAGNILMDSNGSVKLADFGVSASIYESSINSSRSGWLSDIAGTPYWMAPEVILQSNNDGFKADIWSFGITALELAYGRPPLSHLTFSKSLLLKITKRFRFSDVYEKQNEAKKKKKKKFSESFKNMVASCLNQDPSKRPTSEKLLKCSFFKNCKLGSDFLVKNMLVGLQRVEERFKDSYNEGKEITTTEENVKTRRISGWNFNEDRFELQPIFPSELLLDKKVTFGSESIIQERGSNESDESNTSAPSQTDEVIRQLNESEVIEEESDIEEVIEQASGSIAEAGENSGIDREHMLRNLRAITNSLEIQKREAMKLIYNLGGEEGMDINREQLMAQVIETLKMDLDREKMKKVEMEYELEFLKLQISNISSAGGRDSN